MKRSYYARSIKRTSNQTVIVEQWDEEGATLNTHQNEYNSMTLDDIYKKAKIE